jgi:hypothetical protein
MFSLTMTAPCEVQGTIRVTKENRYPRLGPLTDADGKKWDVEAVFGQHVCAVPMDLLHPYFYDTSNQCFGLVHQVWKPYKLEVIE